MPRIQIHIGFRMGNCDSEAYWKFPSNQKRIYIRALREQTKDHRAYTLSTSLSFSLNSFKAHSWNWNLVEWRNGRERTTLWTPRYSFPHHHHSKVLGWCAIIKRRCRVAQNSNFISGKMNFEIQLAAHRQQWAQVRWETNEKYINWVAVNFVKL